ncbi:sushi domain-containing protein 5 isoform X1 [Mobula birostris]|uniref:sushi domain-containing protein 5 isoform X1 n=2 Tax=Mobula birostris TaxID=1983395 RepID=UPI003B28D263
MAPRSHSPSLTVVCFLLACGARVRAHGRMFVLHARDENMQWDMSTAEGLCMEQGAHLATAEELQRSVEECAFMECTTGWIAGNQIGTIMCSNMGFVQQETQSIHVKTEPASSGGQYDAFCIKDKGKPCGDPPSFPNIVLQDYTGTEMGDELLYVCAQGYIMASGENAFSLLCNSCGEWYGFVQACVKDEAEGHIDYEDKFSNADTLPFSVPAGEHNRALPAEDDVEDPGDGLDEAADGSLRESSREIMQPTESPVSFLSQKQLPWFPSEFPNVEQPATRKADVQSKILIPANDNQIAAKAEDDEGDRTGEDEGLPIGPSIVQNETKISKETVVGTNRSLHQVDSYPTISETEESQVTGSMETQEEALATTYHSNHMEIRTGASSNTLANHHTRLMTAPTRHLDLDVQTPVPEIISVSRDSEIPTTTLWGQVTEELWKFSDPATDPSLLLTNARETVSEDLHPVDRSAVSTPVAGVSTFYSPATPEASAQTLTDLSAFDTIDHFTRSGNFSDRAEAKLQPTVKSCRGENCSSSQQGPMIATIVAVIGLLTLAVILATWCYRHRHQKTSVYELNGKGQVRRRQHIEMQQRV